MEVVAVSADGRERAEAFVRRLLCMSSKYLCIAVVGAACFGRAAPRMKERSSHSSHLKPHECILEDGIVRV